MAVSRVLGKQFSNRRKRSGSLIASFMLRMVSSTSVRLKVRHAGTGRWYGSLYFPFDSGLLCIREWVE